MAVKRHWTLERNPSIFLKSMPVWSKLEYCKESSSCKKHFDGLKALLLKNFLEDEKVTLSPYALSKATAI